MRQGNNISPSIFIALFVAMIFWAGCSSPESNFYNAIDAQDIEGISKHYENIDESEQDIILKVGLKEACRLGSRNVLDKLSALGGQLDDCDYFVNAIDKDNDLEFITYVYGKSQSDKKCLYSSMKQAIASSRSDVIRFLIEKGANVNAQSTSVYKLEKVVPNGNSYKAVFSYEHAGETPLFQAVDKYNNIENGHRGEYLKLIELLLKNNANPNLLIVKNQCDSIVDVVDPMMAIGVERGIHINLGGGRYYDADGSGTEEVGNKTTGVFFRTKRTNAYNRTITTNLPLEKYYSEKTVSHIAAERGQKNILALLKKYGADFSIKNSNGDTVLEIMQSTAQKGSNK